MIEINDVKQVKQFVKIIYDINQDFKNIYNSEGYYIWKKGEILSYSRFQFPQFVRATINYNSKNKIFKDIIDKLTFKIEGSVFFKFYSTNKTKLTNIIIHNDECIEIISEDEKLVLTNDNEISENISSFLSKIEKIKLEKVGDIELKEENCIDMINSNNTNFNMLLDLESSSCHIINRFRGIDSSSFLRIITNKKFLIGLKNKKNDISSGNITIYDLDMEQEDIYLVNVNINNKLYNCEQYLVVIDF